MSEKDYCPYCGELIELVVDASIEQQEYIEDCSVCCRPISISVSSSGGGAFEMQLRTEND